jgi:DNA-binding response OmpR family regulator
VRVLVVEDEKRIASFIERGLRAEGFTVDTATDGRTGLELGKTTHFDLIILDLILPEISGEEVLRRLRENGSHVPVIVLTAKDAVGDRIANLDAGADDYMTKPFSFVELVARIRARLRSAQQPDSATLSLGDVMLDLRKRHVRVEGRDVELSSREFALLETFMRHPGQVLSQVELLDQVWGYDFEPGSNVVEVYVGYLRRQLRPDLIQTVRGLGYRLSDHLSNGSA